MDTLPDECILHIISYLLPDTKCIISFRSCNQRLWRLELPFTDQFNPPVISNKQQLHNTPSYCRSIIFRPEKSRDCGWFNDSNYQLTSLSIISNTMERYHGITHIPNLTKMNIHNTNICDYGIIGELRQLQELSIIGSPTNNKFLSNLLQLRTLITSKIRFSNCNRLRNLTKLTKLQLYCSSIYDCTSLSELTNLQILDLSYNHIVDCSPISNLIKLKCLNLRYNKITDSTSFINLINLELLDLSKNQIEDCVWINQLHNLKTLFLDDNRITDRLQLSNCCKLESLDISNNRVKPYIVESLASLKQLRMFAIRGYNIQNCRLISKLTQITLLDLSYNKITDFSPLGNIVKLNKLNLHHNPIRNWSSLLNMHQLEYINITNTPLKNRQVMGSGLLKIKDYYSLDTTIPRYSKFSENPFIDSYIK